MAEPGQRVRRAQSAEGAYLTFRCPGCGDHHAVPIEGPHAVWKWNDSLEYPTLTPSLLVRSGHFVTTWRAGEPCWCTYKAEHPDDAGNVPDCYLCHSFVTDGRIQFLGDCSHKLAGQSVDLPEVHGEWGGEVEP